MKYGSKTASDTLIGAENRFGRVETMEIGPKIGELSRTAAGNRRAEPRDRLCRCVPCGRSRKRHVVRCASGRGTSHTPVRVDYYRMLLGRAGCWALVYWTAPQVFGLQADSIGPWVWSRVGLAEPWLLDWFEVWVVVVGPRFHGLDLDWV